MSAPSFAQLPPPPLPLGWSEHIAPGGQTYYYNAEAQVSTIDQEEGEAPS